jgi:hypothetical protein
MAGAIAVLREHGAMIVDPADIPELTVQIATAGPLSQQPFQEGAIDRVLRAESVLEADERRRARRRDADAVALQSLGIVSGLGVAQPASAAMRSTTTSSTTRTTTWRSTSSSATSAAVDVLR